MLVRVFVHAPYTNYNYIQVQFMCMCMYGKCIYHTHTYTQCMSMHGACINKHTFTFHTYIHLGPWKKAIHLDDAFWAAKL